MGVLHKARGGFTLIEMSIVLVVIGLIVGGVLVGRDLIKAAEARATISQIEKYNTATNAFRGKYGYLPGDIKDPDASMFGFAPRGQYAGEGDGNGKIEGILSDSSGGNSGQTPFSGEEAMFWVDLSKAGLIDGTFNTATPTGISGAIPGSAVGNYFPPAKTGNGGYVYVWSGGWRVLYSGTGGGDNYFAVTGNSGSTFGTYPNFNFPSLTVSQAYAIDAKIDDGLPQSGNVMALDGFWWASGGGGDNGDADWNTGGPVASPAQIGDGTPAGPNSCYDGSQGLPEQYSVASNGGSSMNCAVSFRFQ